MRSSLIRSRVLSLSLALVCRGDFGSLLLVLDPRRRSFVKYAVTPPFFCFCPDACWISRPQVPSASSSSLFCWIHSAGALSANGRNRLGILKQWLNLVVVGHIHDGSNISWRRYLIGYSRFLNVLVAPFPVRPSGLCTLQKPRAIMDTIPECFIKSMSPTYIRKEGVLARATIQQMEHADGTATLPFWATLSSL
uniref:Secreted protein n=1 Tax=Grammatophora oceanica TaxID=210454 RepID=A0A7S1Y6A0_9STRA|mmetsp:Transcript_24491/g.35964  ORF Transcript_24491/g.35964 Transcript_24491/m.35964 type:complete len:194 (+) Transcript_24491:92-673(+)